MNNVLVVGAGPAGLSCAVTAAQRGHAVTLFDAASEIGGIMYLKTNIASLERVRAMNEAFRAASPALPKARWMRPIS